jgi:hypothetical protein
MNAGPCILCYRADRDAAGELKHEASCAHFMRGPDPGGDPHEWPTLMQAIEETPQPLELELELTHDEGKP